MGDALVWFVIGLVVGWFFLPSPEWARELVKKIPVIGDWVK